MNACDGKLRCDGFGCDETYPLEHDYVGQPGFEFGRWLGWFYLDLNRPDLYDRHMRFCSTLCLRDWIEREIVTHQRRETALDRALRNPKNAIAVAHARRELRA